MDTTSAFATISPPPARRRGLLRSTGAVLAGLFSIVVTSTVTDAILHAVGIYPPPRQRMSDTLFLLATAYRIAFGVLGCYVTAWLAPARPMKHALVLGAIGVVISTAGAVAMWQYGPAWYALAIIGISLPCAWLGARLYQRRTR